MLSTITCSSLTASSAARTACIAEPDLCLEHAGPEFCRQRMLLDEQRLHPLGSAKGAQRQLVAVLREAQEAGAHGEASISSVPGSPSGCMTCSARSSRAAASVKRPSQSSAVALVANAVTMIGSSLQPCVSANRTDLVALAQAAEHRPAAQHVGDGQMRQRRDLQPGASRPARQRQRLLEMLPRVVQPQGPQLSDPQVLQGHRPMCVTQRAASPPATPGGPPPAIGSRQAPS